MTMRKILTVLFMLMIFASTSCAKEYDVFGLAEYASPSLLKNALKNGADFNVTRNITETKTRIFDYGETPLHIAATFNTNPKSIKFLIEQGLNVNAVAGNGKDSIATPLSCALKARNLTAVPELLKGGADTRYFTFDGLHYMSAIHYVSAVYSDDLAEAREMIGTLIEGGADVNLHDEEGQYGYGMGVIAEELRKAAARSVFKPRTQWKSDDPFDSWNINLSRAAVSFFAGSCTPLMYAVMYDNTDAVNILLDFNADVKIRSLEGKTALDYADELLPKDSSLKKSSAYKRLKRLTIK